MSKSQPGFELSDIPNALIGVVGIRTESELPYKVVKKFGAFEIRELEAHSELSVTRKGNRKDATNGSFDELLAYIKGANDQTKKYSMTAPVWESESDGNWQTSFYLEEASEKLPLPQNKSLSITRIETKKVAVYRFSGSANDRDVQKAVELLTKWLDGEGLKTLERPRLAQFDPPFAIPFLRRNEIQVTVS